MKMVIAAFGIMAKALLITLVSSANSTACEHVCDCDAVVERTPYESRYMMLRCELEKLAKEVGGVEVFGVVVTANTAHVNLKVERTESLSLFMRSVDRDDMFGQPQLTGYEEHTSPAFVYVLVPVR